MFWKRPKQLLEDLEEPVCHLTLILMRRSPQLSCTTSIHHMRMDIKPEQMWIWKIRSNFLGLTITSAGIYLKESKRAANCTIADPVNFIKLNYHLGRVNLLDKLVVGVADVYHSLSFIIFQHSTFMETYTEATQLEIKKILCYTPALTMLSQARPPSFWLTRELGAILCEKQNNRNVRPITYESGMLSTMERKYTLMENKALAIILCIITPPACHSSSSLHGMLKDS